MRDYINWGDGWGWALFTPESSKKNASADYRNDCLGCHEVAKNTEGVFIQGYPALRRP
ncbi:MAG: cytochrome P460 family protein [Nitrospirae bacterium]|nr:cytochrome P460 family protein [Nitrospirota bacterium]